MKIHLTSVFVADQQEALEFYTRILGFEQRMDLDLGEYRWLTVVDPEEPDGPELLLEPNAHEAASAYQRAIHDDGIPAASFAVTDLDQEYARLLALNVTFTQPPTAVPGAKIAVFDDSCGNLIQLVATD